MYPSVSKVESGIYRVTIGNLSVAWLSVKIEAALKLYGIATMCFDVVR